MPKIVDPEQRRAGFVSASWDVIAAEGLTAATLRRVAAQAGCTTGALTHYFSDRGDLLFDALRSAHYAAGARMMSAMAAAASDRERLVAVLREALPLDAVRLREWKVWLAFWAVADDARVAAENARRYQEWRALLTNLLAPLTPDAPTAREETALLVALVDGLGLHLALFGADARSVAHERRACEARLKRYLRRFAPAPRRPPEPATAPGVREPEAV